MPTFIALVNFTGQGIHDVKNSLRRAERVKKLAARHRVKVRDIYWTMGRYDIVVTLEAPDDRAISSFTLDNGRQGNVRTETLRAYDAREFASILKALK